MYYATGWVAMVVTCGLDTSQSSCYKKAGAVAAGKGQRTCSVIERPCQATTSRYVDRMVFLISQGACTIKYMIMKEEHIPAQPISCLQTVL
jgi:hypothetical protein